jgi:hypothetical protein
MTCLPKWEGMDAIFVVVDRFFQLTKFRSTHTNTSVAGMQKLFFGMWVQHNGMPEVIVSDWDVEFMSKFWMLLMKMARRKLKFNTAFHPQTNGQIKIMNGILNQYFRNYIVNDHEDWGDHLGLAKFCYNFTKHLVTKNESLWVGPRSWNKITHGSSHSNRHWLWGWQGGWKDGQGTWRKEIINDQAFRKTQMSYEKQTNKLQKHIKFEVGDLM